MAEPRTFLHKDRKFLVSSAAWEEFKNTDGSIRPKETTTIEQFWVSQNSNTLVYRKEKKQGEAHTDYFQLAKQPSTALEGHDQIEMRKISASEYDLVKQLSEPKTISKTRYFLNPPYEAIIVDAFDAPNQGCLLAELDNNYLSKKAADALVTPGSETAQTDSLPTWLGSEVTNDQRYYNQHIAEHGFPGAKAAKIVWDMRNGSNDQTKGLSP